MDSETFNAEFEHTVIRGQGDIFEINMKEQQLQEMKKAMFEKEQEELRANEDTQQDRDDDD